MDGIFILDKPPGISSQQAVTKVRRLLGAKKAGHGGTLDPDATGLLVIYLNQATRLAEYMLTGNKEYLAEVTFGHATDTQDASGQITERGDPTQLSKAQIEAALGRFVGTYEQVPPAFSALKIKGKAAYQMAREGLAVELAPRLVTVDWIRMESFQLGPETYQTRFRIACGKGTYIRTICHDLGIALGVPAHMSALVRTRSGDFTIAEASTFDQLESAGWSIVLPPERGVQYLPKVLASPSDARKLAQGQTLELENLPQIDESSSLVRVHSQEDQLLAICALQHQDHGKFTLAPKKVFLNAEVD